MSGLTMVWKVRAEAVWCRRGENRLSSIMRRGLRSAASRGICAASRLPLFATYRPVQRGPRLR
jgi:hypothetical protein